MVIVEDDLRIIDIVFVRDLFILFYIEVARKLFNSILHLFKVASFYHENNENGLNLLVVKGCYWIGYQGVIKKVAKNEFLSLTL